MWALGSDTVIWSDKMDPNRVSLINWENLFEFLMKVNFRAGMNE